MDRLAEGDVGAGKIAEGGAVGGRGGEIASAHAVEDRDKVTLSRKGDFVFAAHGDFERDASEGGKLFLAIRN